jgi:hypothetical protein
MGELVKLAAPRGSQATSRRGRQVHRPAAARHSKDPIRPEHSLAVSVLKNMLGSHGLMLRHKDQTERELTQQPPTKPVA